MQPGSGVELPQAGLQATVLDAVGEALGAALVVFDGRDRLVFANRQVAQFFPVAAEFLTAGTRLRDLFGALYDAGCRIGSAKRGLMETSREEWIAEQISAQWRERADVEERDTCSRWIRYSRRRLPSGFGMAIITDVTERKKREEQWRSDMERVRLTEEILDTLHNPVFVLDRHLAFAAVNRAFCALQGHGADGLLGAEIAAVFEPELASRLQAACRHTLASGASSIITERLRLDDRADVEGFLRIQRVGLPGRYFVVITIEGAAGLKEGLFLGGVLTDQTVPAARSTGKEAGTPVAPAPSQGGSLAGRKILLVTPDGTVEATSLAVLAALGAEACAVQNVAEEQAFLRAAQSAGISLDLVLIDSQMDMRCLELAEGFGREVLALDAFELTTDLPGVLARKFSETSNKIEGDDWEISTTPPLEARPASRNPVVLVAEDNAVNQIVFSQILENLGYSFRIAETGEEAVRLWRELNPMIVLMDITLPVMNGLDACRAIRRLDEGEGKQTPIVGVMVQSFDNGREECLAAGMNDVILKPLSPEMISTVLRHFVGGAAIKIDEC